MKFDRITIINRELHRITYEARNNFKKFKFMGFLKILNTQIKFLKKSSASKIYRQQISISAVNQSFKYTGAETNDRSSYLVMK